MKAFFDVLSVVFLALGGIIGAGFVSGNELVSFFGAGNFAPAIILSAVLTFFSICLVFSFAVKEDMELTVNKLFGKSKTFSNLSVICNFLFFASMLAGLDAVWNSFGILVGVPVLSVLSLAFISVLGRFGVKGLEKFNLYLMPFVVIVVLLCALTTKGVSNGHSSVKASSINAVLYCFLNVYVIMPTLFATAKGKSKKTLFISALTTTLIVALLSTIILLTVRKTNGAEFTDMPFYTAVLSSPFKSLLIVAIAVGALTSGAISYYPVYQKVKGRFGEKGILVVGVFAFLLSRMGLTAIIKYVYPLVAGVGGVFVLKMAIVKFGIKVWRIIKL